MTHPLDVPCGLVARRRFRDVLCCGVAGLMLTPVAAQDFAGFACGAGEEVSSVSLRSEQAGWGTAARLLDASPYSGWATGNPDPASAIFDLGGVMNVTEVHLWVASQRTGPGTMTVEARLPSGAQADVGGVTFAQPGWSMVALDGEGADHIRLMRDPGEDPFELKVCASAAANGPTLGVEDASVTEGDTARVTVRLSEAANGPVGVDYATRDDSARAPGDYVAAAGTLTIPSGARSATISIDTVEDRAEEAAETFFLSLSNPSGAALGAGDATVTINDDDTSCVAGPGLNDTVPQACAPEAMGIEPGLGFRAWRDFANPGYDGEAALSQACMERHDLYWVRGDDGRAYHTWHPAAEPDGSCVYQHEHGIDPGTADAALFDYAGGYPPFGYVNAQLTASLGGHDGHAPTGHRHEPHFGHKVVVANDIRMALGEPQRRQAVTRVVDPTTNDFVTCDWYSKIHQGSYSADAITNHLHEYFLNFRCDDATPGGEPTAFSVKTLAEWGGPNTVEVLGGGVKGGAKSITTDAAADVASFLPTVTGNGFSTPTPPARTDHAGSGGQREWERFSSIQWKRFRGESTVAQPELWSGNSDSAPDVMIPGGGAVFFAPYYVVKNPARLLLREEVTPENDTGRTTFRCDFDGERRDCQYVLRTTVDACYSDRTGKRLPNGERRDGHFCSILPETYPGPDFWRSSASPFNGTVRAVNFKTVSLEGNANGPTVFCTDAFGETPSDADTNGRCADGKVLQRAARADTTDWGDASGTIERWTFGYEGGSHEGAAPQDYQKGEWVGERASIATNPNPGTTYPGAGIGYEWIIVADDRGVRVPN